MRKLREFKLTLVYTGEPVEPQGAPDCTVAMHNTVLDMGTLMSREKKLIPKWTSKNLWAIKYNVITMNIMLQMKTSAVYEHQYQLLISNQTI